MAEPTPPSHLPEVGECFDGGRGRQRCCEQDWGGTHYHCPACGEVCSMYGHAVGFDPLRRSCTGDEIPDEYGAVAAIPAEETQ